MKNNEQFIGYYVNGGVSKTPSYQSGGSTKKTFFVDSEKNPRYKAYQDSLSLYNKGKADEKKFLEFINSIGLDKKEIYSDKLQNQKSKKIEPTKHFYMDDSGSGGGFNSQKSYTTFNKKNGSTFKIYEDTNTFKILDKGYRTYDKPKQKVEVSKQVKKTEDKKTNNSTPDLPRISAINLPPLKIDQPSLNIPEKLVEGNLPVSYDISYDAPNLIGGQMPIESEFLDNRNVSPEELKNIVQRKNNYNNYIEEKYGNEEALKNPKAVERLKKLKQSVEITPNYKQLGGKITLSEGLKTSLQAILKK